MNPEANHSRSSGAQGSSSGAAPAASVEASRPPGVLRGSAEEREQPIARVEPVDPVLTRLEQLAELVALGKGIDEAAVAIGATIEEAARLTRHSQFSALIGAAIARHGDVRTRILAEAEASVQVLRTLRDKESYSKSDETRRKIAEKFLALAGHIETKRSEKAVFHIPVAMNARLAGGLRELQEMEEGE